MAPSHRDKVPRAYHPKANLTDEKIHIQTRPNGAFSSSTTKTQVSRYAEYTVVLSNSVWRFSTTKKVSSVCVRNVAKIFVIFNNLFAKEMFTKDKDRWRIERKTTINPFCAPNKGMNAEKRLRTERQREKVFSACEQSSSNRLF